MQIAEIFYFCSMSDFSVPMTVDSGSYVFAFTCIKSSSSEKYFIKVRQAFNDVAAFEMKQTYSGDWKVTEPVPAWIRGIEGELSASIKARLSEVLNP